MAMILLAAEWTQADLLLRIDSIPGTSNDDGRKDWIEIAGFGIGIRATDSDGLPITPRPTPLRIDGPASTSSPLIFAGVASGTDFDFVQLDITRQGTTPEVLAYWRLTDARIIRYETLGDSKGTVNEQYDIAPQGSVIYGFNELDELGGIVGNVEFTWNLVTGAASTVTTGTVTGFQFLSGDVDISNLPPVIPPLPLPGDYNANGAVDAADYTVWRDALGSTLDLAADGDASGTIDEGDYTLWKSSFGNTAAGAVASRDALAAVPEPATVLLATIAALAMCSRRHRVLRLANLLVLWLAASCTTAQATAPFFMGLGNLPGGGLSSFAYDVSADGSVVVGQALSSSGAEVEAFRWTQPNGMVGLGGAFSSIAFGTSADGSVVVGYSGADAFRWTLNGGMEALPPYPYGSRAHGVSADGSVVVGIGVIRPGGIRPPQPPETEAFRWTQNEGLISLGDLPGGLRRGSASAVSADGAVVVGYGYSASGAEAFRWTQGGGMVGLGDLSGGGFSSMAEAVSADGSVVVGYGNSAAGIEAFRWTQDTGMVGLGILPGFISSRAGDVSADGSVIIGWGHSATDTEAFLWDETHGIRSVRDVLVNDFGLGASIAGWNLEYARGISADGRVVVGYGFNPNGDREAWIARLMPTLPGDYNNDGAVDAADYTVWQDSRGQTGAGLAADGNASGTVDEGDYTVWKTSFGRAAAVGAASRAAPSPPRLGEPVPEPASLVMLLVGTLAISACCRGFGMHLTLRAGVANVLTATVAALVAHPFPATLVL